MAYGLKPRYDRADKRQAQREQEVIDAQFDRVRNDFESIIFKDDFDERFFQVFNDQWIKWANAFNNKKVICLANPRCFHDYALNQNLYE